MHWHVMFDNVVGSEEEEEDCHCFVWNFLFVRTGPGAVRRPPPPRARSFSSSSRLH